MTRPKIQRKRPKETPLQAVIASLPKRHGYSARGIPVHVHGQIHDRVLERSGLGKIFKRQGFLYANDEKWLDKAYDLGRRLASSVKIKSHTSDWLAHRSKLNERRVQRGKGR